MIKIQYLIIIVFSLVQLYLPAQNIIYNNDFDTIEVEVQILTNLDQIGLPPYCGTIKFDKTFEYRLIKLIKGSYSDSTILINHDCPRECIENKLIEKEKSYIFKLKKRTKPSDLNKELIKIEENEYKIIK